MMSRWEVKASPGLRLPRAITYNKNYLQKKKKTKPLSPSPDIHSFTSQKYMWSIPYPFWLASVPSHLPTTALCYCHCISKE